MHHHHFIIILLSDRESFIVPIYLIRPEVTKGAVSIHIGNGSQQGLIGGLVFKRDHEQFIMAVWISEFDAAVHVEFQRRRKYRDSRLDFDPLVCLIRTPVVRTYCSRRY